MNPKVQKILLHVFGYITLGILTSIIAVSVVIWHEAKEATPFIIARAQSAQAFSCANPPYTSSRICTGEHPRIYLTNSNLPEIRAKIQNYYQTEFQNEIDVADNGYENTINGQISNVSNQNAANLIRYAFLYIIGEIPGFTYGHTSTQYATAARVILNDAIDQGFVDFQTTVSGRGSDLGGLGHFVSLSVAYDWLFDLLSDTEKQAVVDLMVEIYVTHAEPNKDDLFLNYALGASRAYVYGMAFYGDGFNDTKAQEMTDEFVKQILSGRQMDAANWISRGGGGWSEGVSYMTYSGHHLYYMMDAWRTSSGENYFTDYTGLTEPTFFKYIPNWLAYITFPKKIPNIHTSRKYNRVYSVDQAIKSSLYQQALNLRGMQTNFMTSAPDMSALSVWMTEVKLKNVPQFYNKVFGDLIWGNRSIAPQSPMDLNLPLTHHFEGLGSVVMRGGWDSEEDSFLMFHASPYLRSSHSSYTQNSFIIQKHGPLAIHAGQTGHWTHSDWTLGVNSMIFPDPNEDYNFKWSDYSGQRRLSGQYSGHAREVSQLTVGSPYDIGGVMRHEASPGNYDYSYSDGTRAYNSTQHVDGFNDAKIDFFTRQFVYLRPSVRHEDDYIVIFDRAKTVDPKYEKHWLLHMSYEPEINDTGVFIGDGTTEYQNADLVTITNTHFDAHGRLFSKTLLPENNKMLKVGGPGYEYWNPFTKTNETKGGATIPPLDDDSAYTNGRYRIEVIPTDNETYNAFLHVMQAVDANDPVGSAQMVDTALVTSNEQNMQGAFITASPGQKNAVVLFTKEERILTSNEAVTYTIDGTGPTRHLIADLPAGISYDIYDNGTKLFTKNTKDIRTQKGKDSYTTLGLTNLAPAGTLYFDTTLASTHTIQIVPASKVPSPPPPNITLQKSANKTDVQPGDIVTFTITYTNNGAGEARNVRITDNIPANTTYVVGSASQGGVHIPAQNNVTWSPPPITPGGSGQVTFQVRVE
jgi:uncharacterized repeat protein (TIGR01451 family)